eukprot:Seg817.5 transcript_id=Seg817.5/GoldUCD/mRNA.D3Y31 product="Calcium homeostasis endoplasmic reticulum protein" protein_id=Seg817.5/GoldUCD/D3Y31
MHSRAAKDEFERMILMENVLEQHKTMSSGDQECKCDFCCVEEAPIVASDGFLFRCSVKDTSYIPVEIIELNEFIRSLQKRIAKIAERGRSVSTLESKIEESNVGHQMLKKMGWGGKGLGREERGIQEPIKGGDVREKGDMFKLGKSGDLKDFEEPRQSSNGPYIR